MEGWVRFHRKIEEWEWYTDPNTFRLFFHLVMKANHEDGKWKGQLVKKGQHITSIGKLGSALNLSDKQIRTALDKLKNTDEIETLGTNKNTVVTVVNYGLYQDKGEQKGEQKAIQRQSKGEQRATNKNEKNEKNEKNYTPLELAIEDYKEFRIKLKKPMTNRAITLLINKLDKMANDEETKIAILEQSILNGWQGIFELKEPIKSKTNGGIPLV